MNQTIKASDVKQIGEWDGKPLYRGKLVNHPNKADDEWPFVIHKEENGKRFIKVYDKLGQPELKEIEFI